LSLLVDGVTGVQFPSVMSFHNTTDTPIMSTYAILGATGNCGTALIEHLLASPTTPTINAYCRNKAKLVRSVPKINNCKKVNVFEGNITDVNLLTSCIKDCKAVFMVVTSNDNIPGCRLGQDTAETVISALGVLKSRAAPGTMQIPKLVLLSSATIDDHLAREMPWWFRPIMLTAASNVYNDLRVAERFLRAQEDWVSTIFIKPGGLSVDVQRGHTLSLDREESFISYLDLAAAMIEAADCKEGIYDMKNVSVVNVNGGARFPPGTPKCILMGLLRHYFPFLHPYLPFTGPS
jgi:putative NADH-flavin reductase